MATYNKEVLKTFHLPDAYRRCIGIIRPRSEFFSTSSSQAAQSPTSSQSTTTRVTPYNARPIAPTSNQSIATKDIRRLRREHSRSTVAVVTGNAQGQESVTKQFSTRSPADIIVKKRDGGVLDPTEIHWFIEGFHRGYVKDYQMASFLMAACVRGMSNRESAEMTHAMVATGKTADLSMIQQGVPKIDKHSTGGVGDKVSLILTPLAASLGIVVPMMSDRGLRHTGGTIDKLSAIPGFRPELSTVEYLAQLEKIGCAIVASTEEYAPIDKAIYALRDVTGTIESVGLVASSIMCKKLAEKPDALLLDVKMGRGGFFKTLNDAASLASTMVAIGEEAGIATCCMVSSMDQPLGSAVGNWLETREAVQILSGRRGVAADPLEGSKAIDEVKELTLAQVSLMMGLGGLADSFTEGYQKAKEKLESGECLHKFAQMVKSQGGDPEVLFDLSKMPLPSERKQFLAPYDCIVEDIDAHQIGLASLNLGAGRHYADDDIDHYAGLLLHKKVGWRAQKGEAIFTAFVGDIPTLEDPVARLNDGFQIAKAAFKLVPIDSPYLILKETKLIEYFVDRTGVQPFEVIKDS